MLSFKQLDVVLLRWLDYFIPAAVKEEGWDVLRRARLIVGAIFLCLCVALFDAAVRGFYDNSVNFVIDVVMVLSFSFGFGLLRLTLSVRVAGVFICINTLLLSAFSDIISGGAYPQTMYWFAMVPVVSVLLTGTRWGFILMLASITTVMGIAKAKAMGVSFPQFSAHTAPENAMSMGFDVSLMCVTMYFFIWLFERSREGAMSALEKTTIENHQLAMARDLAEASERQKAAFLARMSHEFRTPLNAILGYSEMVKEELEDEGLEESAEDLQKVKMSGMHLLQLIDGLLQLSELEAGDVKVYPVSFALDELLGELLPVVEPIIETNRNTLRVQTPPRGLLLHQDSTKLQQILFHLLSNAAKFTREGLVELVFGEHERDGVPSLCCQVRDTGVGIEKEYLSTVFGVFEQADESSTRSFDGSGLGLSLTRFLCQMLGGDVDIESEVGQGTCVTVWLPKHYPAVC